MAKKVNISGEYIFKNTPDGLKFVGNFDKFYSDVEDPWGQIANNVYKTRRMLLLNTLLDINPHNVLDVGSGLGHATQLTKILVTHNVLGVDISKVAVKRAKALFPDVDFKVMDIRKQFPKENYDAIILNNILWYILEDFKNIVIKATNHLSHNGHLIIPQAFIEDQKYGCDIIHGYDGLIKFLNQDSILKKYTIVKTTHINSGLRKSDSITLLRKKGQDGY